MLTITGSPRSTNLFQGLDFTLVCRIEVDSAVDTSINVTGVLSLDNDSLVDGSGVDDGGDVIPEISNKYYEISILFQPLSIDDAGTYTCSVMVTSQNQDFVSSTTVTRSHNIEVEGKYITCLTFNVHSVIYYLIDVPLPLVDISDEGEPIAGYFDYALICVTERDPYLSSLSTLAVQWLNSSGNKITGGVNFTIFESGPTNDTVLESRLSFSNLYTSQAGVYECRALLSIPGTDINYSVRANFSVHVKC